MKIAICVSGLLRDYEKSFKNLKEKIIQDRDVDLFIHSWMPEEDMIDDKWGINSQCQTKGGEKQVRKLLNVDKKLNNDTVLKLGDMDVRNQKIEDIIKEISDIHPIADYHLEKQSSVTEEILDIKKRLLDNDYMVKGSPYNLSCWLYSLYECNNLKNIYTSKHDVKYDLVIRCRTELEFLEELTDSQLGDCKEYELGIPAGGDYKKIGINDTFAIGIPTAIDWYCDIKNHVEKYSYRYRKHTNPHSLFYCHLHFTHIYDKYLTSITDGDLEWPKKYIGDKIVTLNDKKMRYSSKGLIEPVKGDEDTYGWELHGKKWIKDENADFDTSQKKFKSGLQEKWKVLRFDFPYKLRGKQPRTKVV